MTDFDTWRNNTSEAQNILYNYEKAATSSQTNALLAANLLSIPPGIVKEIGSAVKNANINIELDGTDKLKVKTASGGSKSPSDGPECKTAAAVILDIWYRHTQEVPTAHTPSGNGGRYEFEILANGTVNVYESSDKSKNKQPVATAYSSTDPKSTTASCGSNVACANQLAVVNETNGLAGLEFYGNQLDEDLSANIFDTAKLGKEHSVANSYAILKRMKWRAHSNENPSVWDLKNYRDANRDEDVALVLAAAYDATGLGGGTNDIKTRKDAILKFTDAEYKDYIKQLAPVQRTKLGRTLEKCVETVNENTNILRATMHAQTFTDQTPRDRKLNRMEGFGENRLSGIMPVYGYGIGMMRGGAYIMNNKSSSQVGGNGDSNFLSNALKSQVESAVVSMGSKNKRLHPETYQKFQKKIAEIAEAEQIIGEFTKKLNDYNRSRTPDTVNAGTYLKEDDIDTYNNASKKIHDKALVVKSAIANIEFKLHGVKLDDDVKPASYTSL